MTSANKRQIKHACTPTHTHTPTHTSTLYDLHAHNKARNTTSWHRLYEMVHAYLSQGCVPGQYYRGQGQRTSRSRPRVFDASYTVKVFEVQVWNTYLHFCSTKITFLKVIAQKYINGKGEWPLGLDYSV